MSDHSDKQVFIGCPTHDGRVDVRTAEAIEWAGAIASGITLRTCMSLLAYNFNSLWCAALNARKAHGITHFCMIHSDVAPLNVDWLAVLLDELDRLQADVVSAVVPIKDGCGVTSTALSLPDEGNDWRRRRLTMHELQELPETFDGGDLARLWGEPRPGPLLINTGLWVADLRRPWCEYVCFTINDRIVRDAGGEFRAEVDPEDWHFSRQLAAHDCRYYVTRKVPLEHRGGLGYRNDGPWGSCRKDPAWRSS